ncbi:MAG: DeoR/GlpR family DNA-binding transcription regulator [Kiritimatiellia bacterium]|nr:DeoR/GlpR family DNA-binding transcription regulator [Lentisphaerota bacterium]
MKPQIRQQQILDRLRAVPQEWRIDQLARDLRVSSLTIRRDLEELEKNGAVVRTVGGCLAVWRIHHADYQARVSHNFAAKRAIGHAALEEVHAGDVLLINDGSTTYHLASCLAAVGGLTVYTNSVAMIGELRRCADLKLYIMGGEYDERLASMGGALLQDALAKVMADTVFLGVDVIDERGRCLTADQETAHTAALMLRHARRKILLADHTKVALRGGVVYAKLSDFDLWITTKGMPSGVLRGFRRQTKIKEVQK